MGSRFWVGLHFVPHLLILSGDDGESKSSFITFRGVLAGSLNSSCCICFDRQGCNIVDWSAGGV